MLGVIELLKLKGLDTSVSIKYVRHQDKRVDVYELMIAGHFERYQSTQAEARFKNCDYIISFIGLPRSHARFLGVYRVMNERRIKDVPPRPVGYRLEEKPDWFYYDLEKADGFEDLEERIVIHWGRGAINWHQWVKQDNDKEVIELLPKGYTRPWPGYLDFILTHDELVRICNNPEANREWVHKLSAVSGVYLITYEGKYYVGAAYGKEGIFGRWRQYAQNGHGGNKKLEDLQKSKPDCYKQFQFSILQTVPKSMPSKEVIAKEWLYKEKLGSRDNVIGLNSN